MKTSALLIVTCWHQSDWSVGRDEGIVLWRIAEGQLAERWAVLDYDALLQMIQDGS